MFEFFSKYATVRAVLVSFAVVAVLIGVSEFLLVPNYRTVAAGFVPFDLQYPLSSEMVAIERGAFGRGIHEAYLRFAVVNILGAMALAVFVSLLWCWLAAQAPASFALPALRYGLLLVPPVGALFAIADTVSLAQLVFADSKDPMQTVTDAALAIHFGHYALTVVVKWVSVGLAALAFIAALLRLGRSAGG